VKKIENYNFIKFLLKHLNNVQKMLNLSSLVLFFLILISLFNISFESNKVADYIDLKNTTIVDSCSFSEYEIKKFVEESYPNYELRIYKKDIYVYPEIQNLSCLKKVDNFFINEDSKTIDVFINDSPKLINLLDQLINGFFCLFLFASRRFNVVNFLNYIIFNLFFHIFFVVNETFFKIIIPFTEPETINQRYFFRVLFLTVLVVKLKNLKIITLFTLILLFFIPDYLGLFAVIFLLSETKKITTYTKFDIYSFSSIPIIYYVSKFLFSVGTYGTHYDANNLFDRLWILSGQRIYHGYSKWYDLQWNFLTFRCNAQPNFKPEFYFKECRDLYGGVLDGLIVWRADPYFSSFVFQFFCLLLLSFVYLDQINKQEQKYIFFLVLIFVSPPMIFLINQGNPDLFIFLISYLVINKVKSNYLLVLCSLFLLFLFKLHPIGGIVGLFYYFIIKSEKNNIILSSAFLVLSFGILTIQLKDFSGYGYQELILTIEEGYGIFHYSKLISGSENWLTYILLLFFLFSLTYSNNVKTIAKQIIDIEKSSYFYCLVFWFLLTSIYSNNSYRLPIFLILFLSLYKIPNRSFHLILLPFIFLIPTPIVAYSYVQIIYNVVFGLSFFLTTSVMLKFVIIEFQELIPKNINKLNLHSKTIRKNIR
jgi:hypothetical protein